MYNTDFIHSIEKIHLTESIKKQLVDGSFGCGTFIDVQKAFDTVEQGILLKK